MQATLCDNCQTPAPSPEAMNGWRKVVRFELATHEAPPPEHPLAAIMGQMGGHSSEPHLHVQSEHDLCSDTCLVAFVQAGYESSVVGWGDKLDPSQFLDAAAPPPEDQP